MGSSLLVTLVHQSTLRDRHMCTPVHVYVFSLQFDIRPLDWYHIPFTTSDCSTNCVLDSSNATLSPRNYCTPDEIPMRVARLVHGDRLSVYHSFESHRSAPLFALTTSALVRLTKRTKNPIHSLKNYRLNRFAWSKRFRFSFLFHVFWGIFEAALQKAEEKFSQTYYSDPSVSY